MWGGERRLDHSIGRHHRAIDLQARIGSDVRSCAPKEAACRAPISPMKHNFMRPVTQVTTLGPLGLTYVCAEMIHASLAQASRAARALPCQASMRRCLPSCLLPSCVRFGGTRDSLPLPQ